MNQSHVLISPDFFTHLHANPFEMLLVIIVAVWLIMMLATASRHRRHSAETAVKICPGCSTPNPGHAGFCRNCGRKL